MLVLESKSTLSSNTKSTRKKKKTFKDSTALINTFNVNDVTILVTILRVRVRAALVLQGLNDAVKDMVVQVPIAMVVVVVVVVVVVQMAGGQHVNVLWQRLLRLHLSQIQVDHLLVVALTRHAAIERASRRCGSRRCRRQASGSGLLRGGERLCFGANVQAGDVRGDARVLGLFRQ